jgi:hypothetical protein
MEQPSDPNKYEGYFVLNSDGFGLTISSLKPSTAGSAALDFPCPNDIDIYPNQCSFKLSTNINGPIPEGTVGLCRAEVV